MSRKKHTKENLVLFLLFRSRFNKITLLSDKAVVLAKRGNRKVYFDNIIMFI